MAELDTEPPPSLAAGRSRTLTAVLTIIVIVLAILPLVLPFPLYHLEQLWIGPLDDAAWLQCGFDCPAATDLERLACLLILGPSLLVAVAAILVGKIGLVRSRRHPFSLKKKVLFKVSLIFGGIWTGVFGCMLWFAVTALAGTTF